MLMPNMELDEIIATLKHSRLPKLTIFVEGKNDIIIYRELENLLEVDVFPAGCRNNILEIYKQREQFSHIRCLFIADKDIWCNTQIPDDFQDDCLIFTSGYSIENEIYLDYKCDEIIDRLDSDLKQKYQHDLNRFIDWYALTLEHNLKQLDSTIETRQLSSSPQRVFNEYDKFIILLTNEIYPNELKRKIIDNFPLSIRGKSLLKIFAIHSGHKEKQIFQSIAVRRGEKINAIFDAVTKQYQQIMS